MKNTTNIPFETAEAIASKHLGVETLQPRNMDALDFHDVSVTGILAALQAAYEAGRQNGKTDRR